MVEPEDHMRVDPAMIEQVSPDASVDAVIERGRRRTLARRTWTGLATVAVVGVVVAAVGTGGEQSTFVDSAGVPAGSQRGQTSATTSTAVSSVEGSPAPSSTPVTGVPVPSTTASSIPEREGGSGSEGRVELEIAVATDADRYRSGDPVTVTIDVCNTSDRDAVEYFADPDTMFRLQMVTEDDRAVAFVFHGRDGDAVQTWVPGECRSYSDVWDQREGEFDGGSGQAAWPGSYTAQVDWFSTDPPPPGMDPGLYDPAMPQRDTAVSAVFVIDQPVDGGGPGLVGDL